MLFTLIINDMPVIEKTEVAPFADGTLILSQNQNAKRTTLQLLRQINKVSKWFKKLRIKINEEKTAAVLLAGKNTVTLIQTLTVKT